MKNIPFKSKEISIGKAIHITLLPTGKKQNKKSNNNNKKQNKAGATKCKFQCLESHFDKLLYDIGFCLSALNFSPDGPDYSVS